MGASETAGTREHRQRTITTSFFPHVGGICDPFLRCNERPQLNLEDPLDLSGFKNELSKEREKERWR